MDEQKISKNINNILVAVEDNKTLSSPFVKWIISISKKCNAHINLIRVVESLYPMLMTFKTSTTNIKKIISDQFDLYTEKMMKENKGITYSSNTRIGINFIEYIKEARRTKSSIIIFNQDIKSSKKSASLPSELKHTIRKCEIPIWIMRNYEKKQRICLLVDMDLNQPEKRATNLKCLEYAKFVASITESMVDIVHSWELKDEWYLREVASNITKKSVDMIKEREEMIHSEWLSSFHKKSSFSWLGKKILLHGNPTTTIPTFINKNQYTLLIMSTLNTTTTKGVLVSSKAEEIIDKSSCSLFLIKSDKFVSPI